MVTATRTTSAAPWPNRIAWILQGLAAAAFFAAAGAKLVGVPMMMDVFAKIGIGQWFRYFTAVTEIIGGFALLTPRTAPYGALLLAATMVGALITHLFILHSSPVGAIVLLLVVLTIAWLRRDRLARPAA